MTLPHTVQILPARCITLDILRDTQYRNHPIRVHFQLGSGVFGHKLEPALVQLALLVDI
jgi:hypothetical protein